MTWTASTIFSGLGGGALGLQRAGFRLVGAIDNDPAAAADYAYLTGHSCTVASLGVMSVEAFRAAHSERPDLLFTSPPCKSFSGCLPAAKARTAKYLDLSDLALRGVWLALEAFASDPIPLILLENVPRILSRGRVWLDQISGLLRGYGYAVRETTHDCGELGGLAQRRRRFLLVARHLGSCPEWLYVPPVRRVRGVGEVLGELPVPLPRSSAAGPLHALPRLSPLNWLRLALIPPGGDWRELPEAVGVGSREGKQNGGHGINRWEEPAHAVVANGRVVNTWASVADPRVVCAPRGGVYGVQSWDGASGTVVGAASADNGAWSIADPRVTCRRREGSLGVTDWSEPSTTIIGQGIVQNGPWQVADPRLEHACRRGSMRVQGWAEPSHTIIGDARTNKGANVADPRPLPTLEGPALDLTSSKPIHLVIQAADGTWHRPLTTLELAVLQGLPAEVQGQPLKLHGSSHGAWRQRIGNAVPPPAAEAIGRSALATLAASREGSFLLCGEPVWVSPEERGAAG